MNDATRNLNPAIGSMLDGHELATRSNSENDGRSFQKQIETTCGGYHSRREAVLRKVDPPNKIVGTGPARRVIFMANPFLDFVGTWTARHGRSIFIECKSTSTHRLPFMRSGGLTFDQFASIKTWRHAGAAVGVLWQFNGRVVLFTPEDLIPFLNNGEKSLTFASGRPVEQGRGSILWDFLPVLAAAIWPPAPPPPIVPRGTVDTLGDGFGKGD